MNKVFIIIVLLIGFNGTVCAAADNNLPAAYLFPWQFDENATVEKPALGEVMGLLVPHHMVVRQKIYEAYKTLSSNFPAPETIFILSPNHYEDGKDAIQMNSTGFRTLFGTLEVDKEIESELNIPIYNFPFYREHGISAHVNFIKYFFPNAKIVPIILKWKTKQKDLNLLAKKIVNAGKGKKTLIIASIDFSHYQTEKVAGFHDLRSENAILRCDEKEAQKLEIDSHASLYVLLKTLKLKNACEPSMYSHTNSQSYTREPLAITTSHFISFIGTAAAASPRPSKINNVFTVIHALTPKIGGEENRFFMGNNRIFLLKDAIVYQINKETKRIIGRIDDSAVLNLIREGEKTCKGRDFGIAASAREIKKACF